MKAHITSYWPGKYGETAKPDVMEKDLLEYTQWILRAGQRGYVAQQDSDGTIYLITDNPALKSFEVRFEY